MVANRCLKLSCDGSTNCDGARRRTTTTSLLRRTALSGALGECAGEALERGVSLSVGSAALATLATLEAGLAAGRGCAASGSGSQEEDCEKMPRSRLRRSRYWMEERILLSSV